MSAAFPVLNCKPETQHCSWPVLQHRPADYRWLQSGCETITLFINLPAVRSHEVLCAGQVAFPYVRSCSLPAVLWAAMSLAALRCSLWQPLKTHSPPTLLVPLAQLSPTHRKGGQLRNWRLHQLSTSAPSEAVHLSPALLQTDSNPSQAAVRFLLIILFDYLCDDFFFRIFPHHCKLTCGITVMSWLRQHTHSSVRRACNLQAVLKAGGNQFRYPFRPDISHLSFHQLLRHLCTSSLLGLSK